MPFFVFEGKNYRWQRNSVEGCWVTSDHRFVHLALQCEISKAAREAGLIEDHNFIRHTPKATKRKPVSVGGANKKSSTAIHLRIAFA